MRKSRSASGKPDRLLAVRSDWSKEHPEGAVSVLAAHRKSIRFLLENRGEVTSLVSDWMGLDNIKSEKMLSNARWESGYQVEEIIGLVDDLYAKGLISNHQAKDLALRLLKQKPVSTR